MSLSGSKFQVQYQYILLFLQLFLRVCLTVQKILKRFVEGVYYNNCNDRCLDGVCCEKLYRVNGG